MKLYLKMRPCLNPATQKQKVVQGDLYLEYLHVTVRS